MSIRPSAGILLHRPTPCGLEVLLAHIGGPFWAHRDRGAWSIPKGELEAGESPLDAAYREFEEELGLPVPDGVPVPLGEVRQRGGKLVTIWTVAGDLDPVDVTPGTFELEWPPGSGRLRSFPEVDRVAWFPLAAAADFLLPAQRPFLERLPERLRASAAEPPPA